VSHVDALGSWGSPVAAHQTRPEESTDFRQRGTPDRGRLWAGAHWVLHALNVCFSYLDANDHK
jgi:hypothetical protein